ncbi:MAG: hypothetical protein ACE5IK_14070 [Acidobacteriota bacterium]
MRRLVLLALGVAALTAAPSSARAGGIDWSADIGLSVGDNAYLNLNLSHFDRDGAEALVVARRLPHPEHELPVVLFLARESGRPLDAIVRLRLRGLSWWDIRARLGVPAERVVLVVPGDAGPPYGKAHGHHKHHGREDHAVRDADFEDWVGARVLSASYGVEPGVVLAARRSGVSLADITLTHQKARRVEHRREVKHGISERRQKPDRHRDRDGHDRDETRRRRGRGHSRKDL